MIASQALLSWYSTHQRPLPWRQTRDPYAVWLSEIILQQTRIDQGTAYWHRFLEAFPTVLDLAEAQEEAILKVWQGLGYYSRARNLHRAAQQVVAHGGFPTSYAGWLELPGVGPYTAAALSSILNREAQAVVDGNVIRVTGRYAMIEDPPTRTESYRRVALELIDPLNPGDSNQALMELGSLVCTPSKPNCGACPLQVQCLARQQGCVDRYPLPKPAPKVKEVHLHYGMVVQNGRLAVVKRASGFWRGLYTLPEVDQLQPALPPFTHLLSHRKLIISIGYGDTFKDPEAVQWVALQEAETLPWPQALAKNLPAILHLAAQTKQ